MRRVKMVVLAVCLCMVCGVVAARGALESDGVSKETKEMVNLLVRIDRLSAEPCLFLNPKKESLYATEIWYTDISTGKVNYDSWPGLAMAVHYNQANGLLVSSEDVRIYDTETKTSKLHSLEISGSRMTLTKWRWDGTEEHFEYEISDKGLSIVSEDAEYGGYEIEKVDGGYDIYEYNDGAREQFLAYSLRIEGDEAIFLDETYDVRRTYKNGILVEVSDETFLPWEIFHYGVTSGVGVYRTEGGNMGPQPDRSLERRTDRDGYLTYEKIEAINADNRNATEVYIGDSLPDTSRLVN